jgi:thioesterase domain-containing protein
MQEKGAGLPFYCVAGMGGTLNNLRKLVLFMGDTRPVYGLQPPGVDSGDERLYQVEALASHYIREIRAVQPSGPYFLGGYSAGGVAAYEMSRQLEEQGERVAFLGFLDSFSPALPLRPFGNRARIHLHRIMNHGPSYVWATIERRLYSETVKFKLRVSRQLNWIFPGRYRYEALQNSWLVAEHNYRPLPWSGKAVLLRAREESALSLWSAVEVDEQHGWGRYVLGGVEVIICPGDHTTMCEEPFVRTLAQKLHEAIERASASLPLRESQIVVDSLATPTQAA